MKKMLFLTGCVAALIVTVVLSMLYNGALWFVNPLSDGYTVQGVDVSRYQGEIDWQMIAEQGIQFAFIKATEGSGHVDESFAYNFAAAKEAGIKAGAYHFFSWESPGKTQAENFIATVPVGPDSMPPVLDVELYGRFVRQTPGADAVREELAIFLSLVEEHYGVPAILYSTRSDYGRYIAGYFPKNPIWIRNVLREPSLPDGRSFTFWQYSHRGWMRGYNGDEFFIDLNVFAGTPEEFEAKFG